MYNANCGKNSYDCMFFWKTLAISYVVGLHVNQARPTGLLDS